MRLWEALEATVTGREVIAECKRHSIDAIKNGDRPAIVVAGTGEVVAQADANGEYFGGDVLAFLGY